MRRSASRAKDNGIVADPGIGAVGDHFPINFNPKTIAGSGMHKGAAFDRKRERIHTFSEFMNFYVKGHLAERDGKGISDKCIQERCTPCLYTNIQPLPKPEFYKRVKTRDVIDMEMADEQEDRFLLGNIPVGLCKAVSCVEDDVIVFDWTRTEQVLPVTESYHPFVPRKIIFMDRVWACYRQKDSDELIVFLCRCVDMQLYRSINSAPGVIKVCRGCLLDSSSCNAFLCLVAVPVGAVIQEVTVKGVVATVNQAGNTLTINNPAQYGCTYPSSGAPTCKWTPYYVSALTGTVPDASAFSLFQSRRFNHWYQHRWRR